jgi:purine-binding chemotaxis protein CheW
MASTGASEVENRELIAFRVGKQEFCIDVMIVREIRGWTAATALPRAPRYVRGVINLRGAVLPIVELAVRLGLPSSEPTARNVIIVVQTGGQQIGLLVDAVSDILTATDSQIQPSPDVASDLVKSFVRGLLPVEGRMISLISLDQVLPPQAEAA